MSDEIKDHHPEIGWSSPVRMRNRIVHGYWSIDLDILVTTARDDLGGFLDAVRALLDARRWARCRPTGDMVDVVRSFRCAGELELRR